MKTKKPVTRVTVPARCLKSMHPSAAAAAAKRTAYELREIVQRLTRDCDAPAGGELESVERESMMAAVYLLVQIIHEADGPWQSKTVLHLAAALSGKDVATQSEYMYS